MKKSDGIRPPVLVVADAVRRLVEAQAGSDEGERQDGSAGARQQDHQPQDCEADVDSERGEMVMCGAADDQISTCQRGNQQRNHATIAPPLPDQPGCGSSSENQMQQDIADVKEGGRRQRRNIRGVQQRYEYKDDQSTTTIANPPAPANSGKILLR